MSKETCSKCGYHLTVLFYTKSCDRCLSAAKEDWFYHGYVVWTNPTDLLWSVQDHSIYRSAIGAEDLRNTCYSSIIFEVREVISREPFKWIKCFPDDHELADIKYKVAENINIQPYTKPTVMIVPGDIVLPNDEVLILNKKERKFLGLDW